MADFKAPLRDMQFALNEVLGLQEHYRKLPGGEEASQDLVDAILEEAARFAETVVAPINQIGDQEGCTWTDGEVTTPNGFKAAYDQFVEGGWPSLSRAEEYGGQNLPGSLGFIVSDIMAAACHSWVMYSSLSQGCMTSIERWGSDEQKSSILPSMVNGAWTGTMCLTESHCGSDLGLLRTRAEPQADGSYHITGTKIFISSGEHDLAENIIHMVLARLPDAPEGTAGISLFIVPKVLVNDDGSLGARNSVSCGSIEHKMGIKGNSTAVLNFDAAIGTLIGPANRGLNCMFTFINESRVGVAQQAVAHIERSFQGSLQYAKERLQMRSATRRLRPDKPADPIIVHPDVRRMLLTQKALLEGARLLCYYCTLRLDLQFHAATEEEREAADRRLALLTPIAKGFVTEVAIESTNYGIQIFGGHGYIAEHGMEQIVRDVRITALYEGTTGIQALDLLGRKLYGSGGSLLQSLVEEIRDFCQQAEASPGMQEFTTPLLSHVQQWQDLTESIFAASANDANEIGAAAVDYLMFSGYTTLAYMWAMSARIALDTLAHKDPEQPDFYQSKIETARFYFQRIMPRNLAHAAAIRAGSDSLMAMEANNFSF